MHKDQKTIVELGLSSTMGTFRRGMQTLEHLMALSGITEGVLYIYDTKGGKLQCFERIFGNGHVFALVPIAEKLSDENVESQ